MSGEFSVYWWDGRGGQHEELRFVDASAAVKAAKRLSTGPAAILGISKRVIITDGGDNCVFEWKGGRRCSVPTRVASGGQVMSWKPIETAPKDRMILVFAPTREGLPDLICTAIWHEDAGFCVCELRYATHWMELPASPMQEAEGE